jgi:transposase
LTTIKIWRIIREYVAENYPEIDFSATTKLGIDETSLQKGHKYITVFANAENGDVLFVCEGKDNTTSEKFVSEGKNHGLSAEQITDVTQGHVASF